MTLTSVKQIYDHVMQLIEKSRPVPTGLLQLIKSPITKLWIERGFELQQGSNTMQIGDANNSREWLKLEMNRHPGQPWVRQIWHVHAWELYVITHNTILRQVSWSRQIPKDSLQMSCNWSFNLTIRCRKETPESTRQIDEIMRRSRINYTHMLTFHCAIMILCHLTNQNNDRLPVIRT